MWELYDLLEFELCVNVIYGSSNPCLAFPDNVHQTHCGETKTHLYQLAKFGTNEDWQFTILRDPQSEL